MESRIEIYDGYTKEELSSAFDSVKDASDWRSPIRADVPSSKIDVVVAAIRYYTATDPEVSPSVAFGRTWPDRFNISSVGYRMGPAGDH